MLSTSQTSIWKWNIFLALWLSSSGRVYILEENWQGGSVPCVECLCSSRRLWLLLLFVLSLLAFFKKLAPPGIDLLSVTSELNGTTTSLCGRRKFFSFLAAESYSRRREVLRSHLIIRERFELAYFSMAPIFENWGNSWFVVGNREGRIGFLIGKEIIHVPI